MQMSGRSSRSKSPSKTDSIGDEKPHQLQIDRRPDESEGAAIAQARLRPTVQAAVTLLSWGNVNGGALAGADINAMVNELAKQAKAASSNDLARLEAMLTVQAHSLDAMFNECARCAKLNMAEYPEAFDRYMRLAFKAQSQCRTTIEALAEIKNPKPFVAVGQANVANGPQQVNNGASRPVRAPAHAPENQDRSNELLEHQHGERLERSAASLTGGEHLPVAALGKVDGATNSTG
jgi:hypothetical protein